MTSTPREIGTLIVVILKANHLPNKRHIGKQDPYCLVTLNGEKRRTKAIKRGGQHPEWDEEFRFTLYEDDTVVKPARDDGTPPPPPPKNDRGPKKIKGGKIMKVSCFADDAREPDLIGETEVDLTEVLTKGETDEWFTLMNKDKFSGKVYLELTFWSNEPAPEKKRIVQPSKSNKQYGGPGSFVPSGGSPSSLAVGDTQSHRTASVGSNAEHSRPNPDSVPSSLRASNSQAQLNLYVPPYEQRPHAASVDKLANDYEEFGVSDSNRRRESFPPLNRGYAPPASPGIYGPRSSYGYDQNTLETDVRYPYDAPADPSGRSLHHGRSMTSPHTPYTGQPTYQSAYEGAPYPPSLSRGPRHSVPSSSGFMPLPNASGFVSLPTHPSEPVGFPPPLNVQATYNTYNTPHFIPHSPAPQAIADNSAHYMTPSSASFPQSLTTSQPFHYYTPSSSVSAPPQHYIVPQQTSSAPLPSQSAPALAYQRFNPTPSPSHDNTASLPPQNATPSSNFTGSRPLPQQPQIVYGQQQAPQSLSVPPPNPQQQLVSYSPTQNGGIAFPPAGAYHSVPPPPPLPSSQFGSSAQPHLANGHQAPGPPPPLPSQFNSNAPSRRRTSLPQPPINYQQHQHVPPPPPHPDFLQQSQSSLPLPLPPPPPPLHLASQSYHPGPPSNPSGQAVGQAQWYPAQHSQTQTQVNYVQQSYS